MTPRETYLYHQIHPLKLLADISAAVIGFYFLWQHRFIIALLVLLAPPLIASIAVMRFSPLEKYKSSALGNYVARSMSRAMEAARLLGMLVMALGAWVHSPATIVLGAGIIVFAWLRGLFVST